MQWRGVPDDRESSCWILLAFRLLFATEIFTVQVLKNFQIFGNILAYPVLVPYGAICRVT